MPVGIQRLNAKKSQPNVHIVFIKPLKGPDEKIAQDFLERIAAQCLPVMRDNHLSVMTLEEFEPNREFVGRNFNAGEVIQLVLKSPGSGRWLPFNYVQMVMMHELAHCKQMNHSRAFWAVRNQYATHMYGLWAKGYRGDGIWGRGASLSSGPWETNAVRPDEEVLPEHLCGGTYRSRRRRRKRKPELSYQERKERRILKKFGKNGVALGADEEAKVKLEKGKKVQAKPRVAGSARGRELRAAAALARFEQQQVKTEDVTFKDESETESGSDSDGYEEGDLSGTEDSKAAVDVNGDRIKDKQGRGMVRVCEDEDASDPLARGELDELRDVFRGHAMKREPSEDLGVGSSQSATMEGTVKGERPDMDIRQIPAARTSTAKSVKSHEDTTQLQTSSIKDEPIEPVTHIRSLPSPSTAPSTSKHGRPAAATEASNSRPVSAVAIDTRSCAMCSFSNAPHAVTCGACANVLNPASTKNSWRCGSEVCRDSSYVNSGDCGVCGICGERKQ